MTLTYIEIIEKARELSARMAQALADNAQEHKELFERNHRRTMRTLGNKTDDDGDDDE